MWSMLVVFVFMHCCITGTSGTPWTTCWRHGASREDGVHMDSRWIRSMPTTGGDCGPKIWQGQVRPWISATESDSCLLVCLESSVLYILKLSCSCIVTCNDTIVHKANQHQYCMNAERYWHFPSPGFQNLDLKPSGQARVYVSGYVAGKHMFCPGISYK